MVNVTITASAGEVSKRLGRLADKSGLVISRAANRSINTGKKALKQETAKIYNVKQKDVEGILRVRRATPARPSVNMTFKDYHRNLYAFGNNDTVTPRYTVRSSDPVDPDPAFLRVKVKRGKSIPMKGKRKPFVQISPKNRYVLVFQRASDERDAPLRTISAPALPQILKNEEVIARFNRDTHSMFRKRLEHEIGQVLKGAAK